MKRLILLLVLASFSILTNLVVAQEISPNINVTLLNQDPDPVQGGDVVEARFKIENFGKETSDNVQIEIMPKYPFSLYSGSVLKDLGKMRASQTGADAVIADYKLLVDRKAVEGDNEIELRVRIGQNEWIVYDDNDFLIDVSEYDAPVIKAYVRESAITQEKSRGTITVEIANVDVADAKFVQLSLLPSEDYQLLSSNSYVYIGDVDSDDTESEDFDIYIENSESGAVKIPILIEYQDDNENKYESSLELELRVFDNYESKKFGLSKRNYTWIILIVISLAVGAYFYLRRKK